MNDPKIFLGTMHTMSQDVSNNLKVEPLCFEANCIYLLSRWVTTKGAWALQEFEIQRREQKLKLDITVGPLESKPLPEYILNY